MVVRAVDITGPLESPSWVSNEQSGDHSFEIWRLFEPPWHGNGR